VFYSSTFIAVGAYLTVMALGGFYVRQVGGEWGRVGQIVFMAGSLVLLVSLTASATLRRQTRVFISKHFYRNKYDYRIEWLRFVDTLSSSEDDVKRTAVRAIAQILASPGGILFVMEDSQRRLVPAAAWPFSIDELEGVEALPADSELVDFVKRTQWVVDLREYRRVPDLYQNMALPSWFATLPELRVVSPLRQLDTLVGLVMLFDPPPPFDLTYEDRDLLKTVGRHVATHIAQHDADRKLAESRQFEAYNRLTAFMMHDLKNSVAQLKLIVANAARHKSNPAFVEDAIDTIANAVERMTRLIEQLRGTPDVSRNTRLDLSVIVQEAVGRTRDRSPEPHLNLDGSRLEITADGERLASVLEHVIRNAQDSVGGGGNGQVSVTLERRAAEVEIAIADTY